MPPKGVPPGTMGDLFVLEAQAGAPQAVYSCYEKFAPIVRHEGFGGQEVWVFEPELAKKMILNEGPYPRTGLGELWMFQKYYADRKLPGWMTDIGPTWKRSRMALQKDMFAPQVADSYLPLLEEPVKEIAKILPQVPRLSDATNYASMDMFLAVMLGVYPHTIRYLVGGKVDPEDLKFISASVEIVQLITQLFQTQAPEVYDRFCTLKDSVIARGKYYTRLARENKDESLPVDPYIARLLRREELSEEEAVASLSQLLFAGVDTTHHILQTLFLDIAAHPDKQEKLYQEIRSVLGDEGALTPENIKELKYLNYVMRESHRLHPGLTLGTMRRLNQEIELGGYSIPPNTMIVFAQSPLQNDPAIVDDVEKFIPERWEPEAVAKRVGTKKEVLDHRLLSDPFGFGPRMCLGARVAKAEIKALVCRVLQQFELSVDAEQKWLMKGFPGLLKPEPYPRLGWKARK